MTFKNKLSAKAEQLVPENTKLCRPILNHPSQALSAQAKYDFLIEQWQTHKENGSWHEAVLACSEATIVSLEENVELDPVHKEIRGLYIHFSNFKQYFSLKELETIQNAFMN